MLAPSASGVPVPPENQSHMELGESFALPAPAPSFQVPQFRISVFRVVPAKASKHPGRLLTKRGFPFSLNVGCVHYFL